MNWLQFLMDNSLPLIFGLYIFYYTIEVFDDLWVVHELPDDAGDKLMETYLDMELHKTLRNARLRREAK